MNWTPNFCAIFPKATVTNIGKPKFHKRNNINDLVQDYSNSSVLAMELLQSYTKLLI